MINISETILKTVKDRINKMRKLADFSPNSFLLILKLIILEDLEEWASYKEDGSKGLETIKKMKSDLILKNSDFLIVRDNISAYRNVNTPQTTDTWKRVWDDPMGPTTLANPISPESCVPWTLDPYYQPVAVYYINDIDPITGRSGKPNNIDICKLTLHEKMNVYINREDGTAWYLDENTGMWKKLESTGMSEDAVVGLIKEMRQGITNELDQTNNKIIHRLTDAERGGSVEEAEMSVTTDNDLEDLL